VAAVQSIHIVMELCKGGDLFERVASKGRLGEGDAARLCKALVEALLHCHCLGIVHRDIKPENILLTDKACNYKMKLVDFGVASFVVPGERAWRQHCTVLYFGLCSFGE